MREGQPSAEQDLQPRRLCSHGESREGFRPTCDEYTGERLEDSLVARAKVEELKFFCSSRVWELAP